MKSSDVREFDEKSLPLDGLELLGNEMFFILGGNKEVNPDKEGSGPGCGCGCGCGC